MDAWVVVVARTVGIVVASYNRDPRFESIYHQSYLLSTVLKRRQKKKRGAQLFKKSECSNDHDQCYLIGHFLKVLINKFWKKVAKKYDDIEVKLLWQIFWQLLEKNWAALISAEMCHEDRIHFFKFWLSWDSDICKNQSVTCNFGHPKTPNAWSFPPGLGHLFH